MATKIRSREALLAELTPVFMTRGYEGATLSQLARATGLGKASLYHHFPGGKEEMAAVLLRDAVASLDQTAFARLNEHRDPAERLARFVDGFDLYVDGGKRGCLVAILGQGSIGDSHGEQIAGQFRDWHARLAAVFEETGLKPKRAARDADALLAGLYGYLLNANLRHDVRVFTQGLKRLKKSLP